MVCGLSSSGLKVDVKGGVNCLASFSVQATSGLLLDAHEYLPLPHSLGKHCLSLPVLSVGRGASRVFGVLLLGKAWAFFPTRRPIDQSRARRILKTYMLFGPRRD